MSEKVQYHLCGYIPPAAANLLFRNTHSNSVLKEGIKWI